MLCTFTRTDAIQLVQPYISPLSPLPSGSDPAGCVHSPRSSCLNEIPTTRMSFDTTPKRWCRPRLSDFPQLQVPSSNGSFGQVTIHSFNDKRDTCMPSHNNHQHERHERDVPGMPCPARVALKRITVRRPGEGIPENLIREIVALKAIQVGQ